MTGFTTEPDDADALQVAGDLALDAIRVRLSMAGIAPDDYAIVLTLEHGNDLATVLHLPGKDESPEAAFEVQLRHLAATASALGLRIAVLQNGRPDG